MTESERPSEGHGDGRAAVVEGTDGSSDAAGPSAPTTGWRASIESALLRTRELVGTSEMAGVEWRLLAAFVATLLTWPIRPDLIELGVDPSYRAALALSHQNGFDFGSQVIFNFGPLGFLMGEPFARTSGLLAWGVQILVSLALSFLLVSLLNARLRLWVATAAAVGLVAIVFGGGAAPMGDSIVVIALLWSVSRAVNSDTHSWGVATALAIGIAGGLALLVKADTGLVTVAVTFMALGVGSAAAGGRAWLARNLVVSSAAMGATAVGVFVLLGNPVDEFSSWLFGTSEIVRGFAAALGLSRSAPLSLWETVGAIGLVVVIVVSIAVRTPRPRLQRFGAAAIAAVGLYATFRQGFVRYDVFHVSATFLAAALTPLAMTSVWAFRRVVAFVLAAVVIFVPGQRPGADVVAAPVGSLRAAARTGAVMLSPTEMESRIDDHRRAVRELHQVPEEMLDLVGDEPFAIVPEALEIAFGYPQLNWVPLPILQEYQAYTTSLDELNADYLSSQERPEWVLRAASTLRVDNHFPRFDSPAAYFALICHYQVVERSDRFDLLQRTNDRCGPIERLSELSVQTGERVEVPSAGTDEVVLARLAGVGDGPIDSLLATLFRGRAFEITIHSEQYRFVPGTQGSWHVLSAPSCVDLMRPRAAVRSFAVGPSARRLPPDGAIDVEFATVTMQCDSDGGRAQPAS